MGVVLHSYVGIWQQICRFTRCGRILEGEKYPQDGAFIQHRTKQYPKSMSQPVAVWVTGMAGVRR
jgi:hypothetical protein